MNPPRTPPLSDRQMHGRMERIGEVVRGEAEASAVFKLTESMVVSSPMDPDEMPASAPERNEDSVRNLHPDLPQYRPAPPKPGPNPEDTAWQPSGPVNDGPLPYAPPLDATPPLLVDAPSMSERSTPEADATPIRPEISVRPPSSGMPPEILAILERVVREEVRDWLDANGVRVIAEVRRGDSGAGAPDQAARKPPSFFSSMRWR